MILCKAIPPDVLRPSRACPDRNFPESGKAGNSRVHFHRLCVLAMSKDRPEETEKGTVCHETIPYQASCPAAGQELYLLQLGIAVLCTGAEFFLNADELVVLGHTVCTRHRTRLDLAGVGGNSNVGDGCILCFA